jgi:hypothetical protein
LPKDENFVEVTITNKKTMKTPCNPIPNDASILYQDLDIRLTVNANVTIDVAPLVLEQKDGEAVCWLTQHCGKPAETLDATGKLRTYTWSYRGAGIFLSQERLLQLPTGQNRLLRINFAQKKRWSIRIRSQMLR